MLTYDSWEKPKDEFIVDPQYKGAINVLKWAYEEYGDQLIYSCSFGIEGIVLIDLISAIRPTARIVFLDTGLHFQETYELIENIKRKYPKLQIEMKKPTISVEEQAKQYGEKLWERQPDRCCYMRKVLPLRETLSNATAWISGLRREQSPSRKNTNFINKDETFQSIKICPLIHWSWKDIWNYVKAHQLPYNPLHDQGYPSIGCWPCTLQGDMETGSRSGRWANQEKTECGLHQN
ncbi:phosphoadenylyl-sulfate reductase [Lederbergia sp. NSJ-179]|uniref:phosphoadenylyl-sulfate reductase n=1 Tax=Lederbergia sp. NSJ-179 TaxID=2931402 RepID=UPI001FD32B43|nr:phosphoadenylyl-sulfate reductase [Lederbergia sp. NSJ-179]MCJ7841193.1 phosphoadenylyl-sulfate reductase [Lederbergia sp. NSJ-179]